MSLNSLISLFANASWGNLAGEFEKANKAGPSLLSVFHNTTLGLPYKLQIDSVGQSFLRSKAEDFSLDNLPEQVLLITCGCDVQMQRIEMLFLGFAVDGTTFILAHQVLHGSTHSGAPVWKQLDNVLGKQYVHPKGYRLKVESCCVDSGGTGTGSESRTQAVYDYTRAKSHRKIFAIKSVPGSRPVWAQAATSKGQSLLILLGIDSLKTDVLAGLAALPFIDNDGNPTATETGVRNILSYRISNTLSDNTLEQLVSEGRFLTTVKGREVMAFKLVRQGARNEALDACCYALGARAALRSVNLRHRAGRSGADEQSKGSMGERFGKLSDASVLG